jgi:hypothetical protein
MASQPYTIRWVPAMSMYRDRYSSRSGAASSPVKLLRAVSPPTRKSCS